MILLVAGLSRAGKSSLARRLVADFGMSYHPMDCLISTLENLYPEMGIRHLDANRDFSPVIARFIAEYLHHLRYEDIDAVLDLYQLYPEDYIRCIRPFGVPILYLGYPHMSMEEKLRQIRLHEREIDWTRASTDAELLQIYGGFIEEGRIHLQQCREYGIPFFDTGRDFQGELDRAVDYVGTLLGENNNRPQH